MLQLPPWPTWYKSIEHAAWQSLYPDQCWVNHLHPEVDDPPSGYAK